MYSCNYKICMKLFIQIFHFMNPVSAINPQNILMYDIITKKWPRKCYVLM